ncbi:putative molybdopterin biosynthesis protein moeB [Staphylococcus piscifermentans]|uniref:Molybdopterin biosynthesis protein MoeB n=1 Tax=Staphylococcus piscifermentans TaxID=70258 RepID=A0A239TQ98_9STAP|nr:ThiF family adenylyltransferase [Staphylococcus piscifermentans]RTX82545.1 molybdopterin biosynthesis protein MoeB [Staphylococcus piscifermentans]GEP84553.1 molybdopterin biosynthesis protein MoeB [Staphylococcus piscifermentans]SNV00131.1 putative molybdopterin biosynthesis protein moeB [Staphylococcus piscifermentans]
MNERYSRQILFENIGVEGQEKIAQKHVLIIGMGALGTHLADGLARAGVRKLTIVDRDYIEFSNLQRQTMYTEQDAKEALPKVIAAESRLKEIREDIEIDAYIEQVNALFLEKHAQNVDLILDATDNFDTRLLVNDFAYKYNIPWIYGGVVQSTYIEAAFIPGQTPCFNCVMPQLPVINMTCDTVGVIQPAVTMTTSLQLRDALKILTETPFTPKLTYGDIWEGTHYTFGFSRMFDPHCTTCGEHPTYPHLHETDQQFATLCGRDTVQYSNENITQEMLKQYLEAHHIHYHANPYMLRFEFNGHRIVSFSGGRMLIHGMTKPTEAIKLMNQLLG